MDREMGREESSVCKTNRLAVHMDELDSDHSYSTGENKNIRSLLFFPKNWRSMKWYNCIKFGIFKYLKVLVLQGCTFENGKLPQGIEKLKLLKLLSLDDSYLRKLPASVCKLPCLQTLNVKDTVRLPNYIYKMRRLRHLFLDDDHKIVGSEKLKLEGLNELETITGFKSLADDITHLLKLPKLRVFHGTICDEQSVSMIVDHVLNHQDQFRSIQLAIEMDVSMVLEDGSTLLRRLVMCHSLHYLRIRDWRVSRLPAYEVQLYQNMIEVHLRGTRIEEDPMKILEKLPMLRVLGLWRDPYVGREMVCRATGFPQLRDLILFGLPNLVEWRVEKGAMPNLSYLYIKACRKLKMIPDELKFITTLKELRIMLMPSTFTERLRVVDGEEGEDYHKIKHIPRIDIYN
ncbi:UNVERIFIED_CONTAM: putative disease resistance RPP8-like protein 2 [Sesamum latifolium]|uniref:Disease resistance RPP8-like protein 2 n=1 Tax=Sesamum latifolium TaxID=2727402 RepID=A0AAW2XT48_9LAMI